MSTILIDHDGNNTLLADFLLTFIPLSLIVLYYYTSWPGWICLCLLWYGRPISKYIFRRFSTSEPRLTPTLPAPRVIVARFPVNGQAPSLVQLETVKTPVQFTDDVYPSHIPDVWRFWSVPENMSTYEDCKTTQIDSRPLETQTDNPPLETQIDKRPLEACKEMYMTFFSHAPRLQENRHVPKMFQSRSSIMHGDVFVAKIDTHDCGEDGRPRYKDIDRQFLSLPCVTEIKSTQQ
jgi:hypothetical protein